MKLKLDIDNFLAEYWQQKPLLIRDAIDNFRPPIDANELAGLAMEKGVESRIIETLAQNWALYHGPFEEADFDRKRPWTLLVQAVDHHVQDVAALLGVVDFIPSWRVDDVMVSYAVDGGSVGPHYDNYDVFLLQGEGCRRWQLGQQCNSSTPLVDHPDLRILKDFHSVEEYILQPGDILYIPPGVAHWGIAQGDGTTFSLGFRAPRINDLVSRWVDELLEKLDPEAFYRDTKQTRTTQAGEIRAEDFSRAREQLAQALTEKTSQHWFGEMVTEPRYTMEPDEQAMQSSLVRLDNEAAIVTLQPWSKLAWQKSDRGIDVFANGQLIQCCNEVGAMLVLLCRDKMLDSTSMAHAKASPQCHELLKQLILLDCISSQ